ncbi:MAG: hypothetical protein Tsb002_10850 [Wenzhouxiangellaceae bacterium]
MSAQEQLPDFSMDPQDLYQEETYTDRKVGSIRVLTPVNAAGDKDASRSMLYTGQTQIMTPAGSLPLVFEIEADSLSDAVDKFGAAAQESLEKTMEEIREMRREAASSIVVPGSGGGGMPGGGMPGGGMPGGGGIQMP